MRRFKHPPEATFAERLFAGIEYDTNGGCWLWSRTHTRSGYGGLGTFKNGVQIRYLAHRISWELHRGPIPVGMFVLHKCDVRACCNPDHLFIGTMADNTADMIAKGRECRGSDHPWAKLTEERVRAARRLRRAGARVTALAETFGVSRRTMRMALNRETWRHVTA